MFRKRRILYTILIASLCCSLFSGYSKRNGEQISKKEWQQDIDYLASELPKKHVNLYHMISEKEFKASINLLKASLNSMNDDEIQIELQKIIATAGDAHTSMNISSARMYPLKLYWFKDGWYVIGTTPEYKEVMYSKLIKINNRNMNEIYGELSKVISHENEAWLKSQMPWYFIAPSVLHGLKIIKNTGSTKFTFKTQTGDTLKLNIKPAGWDEIQKNVFEKEEEQDGLPLYRKNSEQNYWYEYLQDSKTIYFKYNRCSERKEKPFADFTKELFAAVNSDGVEKLVIDLRDNGGGNEMLLYQFIKELSGSRLNQKGKLFILVGRKTFSSAIRNAVTLKKKTQAIFIGEPTGGKPKHYGSVNRFTLPNSGISINYSTMYLTHCILDDEVLENIAAYMNDPSSLQKIQEAMLKDPATLIEDTPSFIPDQVLELSVKDYRNNQDPVLKYALNY